MKAAKITVAGTTYFLVMDGEAMFTIRDIYGGTRLMLENCLLYTSDAADEL